MFPINKAIKFPILVGRNVKLMNLRKGCIECTDKFGIIRLGVNEGFYGLHHRERSFLNFNKYGKLICKGSVFISSKYHINISGRVFIGNNFHSNTGLLISCEKDISFGNDTLIGWNVTIIDGDGHNVVFNNAKINYPKSIVIGNHCWIAANTTILKGVSLMDNTIIPAMCCITKSSDTPNCIFKNKVLKTNINWSF